MAATHVHHVYGGDMNVHRIRAAVGPDVPICLDAAQSVGHLPVDLADPALDVDFVVFSGAQGDGPAGFGSGLGAQRAGPAFRPAGWQGTPNTVGIVSLRAALDWLDLAGPDRIAGWTAGLTTRLTDRLRHLDPYEILGCPTSLAADSALPAPSAATAPSPSGTRTSRPTTSGSSSTATASWCGPTASARPARARRTGRCGVSPHIYNTVEEIDRLLTVLASLA
ncbi:aminotransferase class V-fold PLP-dependent enzyme [Streptomyces thinghirensis]|nr:aminotransferase class V-fold PLP-dependent enzyme [Streptomyces thinghirensis]